MLHTMSTHTISSKSGLCHIDKKPQDNEITDLNRLRSVMLDWEFGNRTKILIVSVSGYCQNMLALYTLYCAMLVGISIEHQLSWAFFSRTTY